MLPPSRSTETQWSSYGFSRCGREEAGFANRRGYLRHKPALPPYTRADAEMSLNAFAPVPFERPTRVTPEFEVRFRWPGHILGAATATLEAAGLRIVFSGDLGRPNDALLPAPEPIRRTDYLVLESTYGDRTHSETDVQQELGEIVRRTVGRGGVVVIPAFAVGRAQALVYHLHALRRRGEIPDVPTYMDSPMAADATRFHLAHPSDPKLSKSECREVFGSVTITNSVEESKAICRSTAKPWRWSGLA